MTVRLPRQLTESRMMTSLLNRRHLIAAGATPLALFQVNRSLAQTSPPIEPRDNYEDDDEESDEPIIEPEIEPTVPPESESGTVVEAAASSNLQYFAETGHNLDEPFASIWETAGGREGPGLPLSESRFLSDDGAVRQDFQAMAFLYRPEDSTIAGVPLPGAVTKAEIPAGSASQTAEVGDAFANFLNDHGGTQVFGTPISKPYTKSGTTRQAFANAIMETTRGGKVRLAPANEAHALSTYADDEAFKPAPPTLGTSWFVKASDGLRVRKAGNAESDVVATVPDNAEFVAAPGEHGAWVPGYVDGVSGWVAAEFLVKPNTANEASTKDWRLDVWEGQTLGESNLRRQPSTSGGSVRTIAAGDPVVVVDWVDGEDVVEYQPVWAKLEDGSFVYARNIGRTAPVAPPPLPADAPSEGKWLDLHLTQQLMVAYEGRTPVRTMVVTTGMPGWETPEGWFAINHRVANETMESGSIGADHFYVLKNVLFTQYFTDRGHALHYAWWKNEETIGRPGSHGCVNLLLDDAQFCWDWAEIGTGVIVRTT